MLTTTDWRPPEPREYGHRHPFDRLWEIRRSAAHRLNANFLDRILRLLPLPERDHRWTEWVRHRAGNPLQDDIVDDIQQAIRRWSETLDRHESDDLDALAMAWLLSAYGFMCRPRYR